MSKHLKRRNMHTFYIPDSFFSEWEKFLENIKKDKKLKKIQSPKFKNMVISLGLRQSIILYNKFISGELIKKITEKIKNETSIDKNNEG